MNQRSIEHLTRTLGRSQQLGDVLEGDEQLSFVGFRDPVLGAVHVATIGLADRPLPLAPNPAEFVCSVLDGQERAAVFLLKTALSMADKGLSLVIGSQAENEQPLLSDTDIRGFVLAPMLWFDEADYLSGTDGMIEVQFLTVLPLIGEDLQNLGSEGSDTFLERINNTDANLLDITRRTPV